MSPLESHDLEYFFEEQPGVAESVVARRLSAQAAYVIWTLFEDENPVSGLYEKIQPGQIYREHELDLEEMPDLDAFYTTNFRPHHLSNLTHLPEALNFFQTMSDSGVEYAKSVKNGKIRYVSLEISDTEEHMNEMEDEDVLARIATDFAVSHNRTMEIVQSGQYARFTLLEWNEHTGVTQRAEAIFAKRDSNRIKVEVSFSTVLAKDPAKLQVTWSAIATPPEV